MLHSALTTQRIFIVGDNSLFEEGITHLLTIETGLLVSNVKYTSDLSFMDMIAQNQPDVILLNESTMLDSAHILELLFSIQLLTALCIIVVRLDNSIVDVYEMPKRFVITKRDELVSVVQGNFDHIVS